jgi:hypothetical protein
MGLCGQGSTRNINKFGAHASKGIFFLTTNLVRDFDEAVCSRIHLFLKYNNLEAWARRKIWKTFLQGADTVGGPAAVSLLSLTN